MPATGNYLMDKGYNCVGAVAKYTAVAWHANAETVTAVAGQGVNGVGISQFEVTTDEITKGKGCSVRREGRTVWTLGATVAKGELVTCQADGQCEPASSGDYVWGEAEQGGDAGDQISVMLTGVKTVL